MKERKMVKANTMERWGEIIAFEDVGDHVEGLIYAIRDIKTEYGIAPIMDLKDEDNNNISIILSSSLQQYSFDCKIGHYVSIQYIGLKKNAKTKRHFKDFEVMISEEAEIDISKDLPF